MVRESRSTRVPLDVYESARLAARATSRTIEEQIAHWVRLGHALEMSPEVDAQLVARVLSGRVSYDSLSTAERAVVRHKWAGEIAERAARLDLEHEFGRAGRHYSELDADGKLVIRRPGEHLAT